MEKALVMIPLDPERLLNYLLMLFIVHIKMGSKRQRK